MFLLIIMYRFNNFTANHIAHLPKSQNNNTMGDILESFKKKVGSLISPDVIDADYQALTIDDSVKRQTKKYATRYRASQRIGKGLFFTDNEKKEELDRMRKRPLP